MALSPKRTDAVHTEDFEKLREACLTLGQRFEDPQFSADDSVLYISESLPRPIKWLRPSEIVGSPQFISQDASRFNSEQGALGDCWLLAAVASLFSKPKLFAKVVQVLDNENFQETGILHFRFWHYGRWKDVVIDDRLPTYNGHLVYVHSEDDSEFWPALLEKAYAKLYGSYAALKSGNASEAMEDLTGGISERYDVDKAPQNLFQILMKADELKSLIGCSIKPDPSVSEAELSNGLIRGHAYSITKLCLADIKAQRASGQVQMIRIRNPWGSEGMWNGAFSQASPEWDHIPEESRKEIGLTFEADGEFWMTFKDFMANFQNLDVCYLSPDSFEDDDEENKTRRLKMLQLEGTWVRNVTAGGCGNDMSKFALNPQCVMQLTGPDADDDEGQCSVTVALMQRNRRELGLEYLTIGYAIYDVPNPVSCPIPLDTNFFLNNTPVAGDQKFIDLREVSCRFKLPPGIYCIVPSTFDPDQEGEFTIRLLCGEKTTLRWWRS